MTSILLVYKYLNFAPDFLEHECDYFSPYCLQENKTKITLLSIAFSLNIQHSRCSTFQMFKLDLEKAEEPEIKLPTSPGSSKNQESSRKTSPSALLTKPKPLTVGITTNWKILKEMGIPDYLTCLPRNLYAGQEATAKTGHGTTAWFQTGKGVRQGCILSPCLFNLYAEYIMWNARLDEE